MKIDYVPAKLVRTDPLNRAALRTVIHPWVPEWVIVRAIPDDNRVFVKIKATHADTGDRLTRAATVEKVEGKAVHDLALEALILLVKPKTEQPAPPPPPAVPDAGTNAARAD